MLMSKAILVYLCLKETRKNKCISLCEFQHVLLHVYITYMNIFRTVEWSLLQVSLDLVKSLYAKFIDWDDQMVDPETGIRSNATK